MRIDESEIALAQETFVPPPPQVESEPESGKDLAVVIGADTSKWGKSEELLSDVSMLLFDLRSHINKPELQRKARILEHKIDRFIFV